MPITPEQKEAAIQLQQAAAHDENGQIRIIAGPGTGKSYTIEERVYSLLTDGINPHAIYAISFTRASAADLRQRIRTYCDEHGVEGAGDVHVSTLHSLALKLLRLAGLLQAYPTSPAILDDWELETIFDGEFSNTNGCTPTRSSQIRRQFEAYWSTGNWRPANYIEPDPPISDEDRDAFLAFHGPRTQTYSCVLPGEVVRKCVTNINTGALDPVALLGVEHLIVDEYQDLNQSDLEFIDQLIERDVVTFVAGDDDQSIYSFRFGSPQGIQLFPARHPDSTSHTLSDCFRCASRIVAAANDLVSHFAPPNRIPKTLHSLYENAVPPELGVVHRWTFNDYLDEVQAIAHSARDLIAARVSPHDILILLSNKRQLLNPTVNALQAVGVPFDSPNKEGLLDSEGGRFGLALLRLISNPDDYVAYRLLLGMLPNVGISTCNAIAHITVEENLNYRHLFSAPLPDGVFTGRSLKALNRARAVYEQIQGWTASNTIQDRGPSITEIIRTTLNDAEAQKWQTATADLPPATNLAELRDYIWADTDEQQGRIKASIFKRLELPFAEQDLMPPRVRIMTMHGAKGLSGKVVFIPGLEETIFPGNFRIPFPGLVLEAARLLYVSLTRARSACIMSHSARRLVNGRFVNQQRSRFLTNVGGGFVARHNGGLTAEEIQAVTNSIANL